jgi:hypothetical protein
LLPQRTRIAIVGALGTVAAFFMFGGFGMLAGGGPVLPEAAVPKTSFLVATVNVGELRTSPIYQVIFSDKPDTSLLDRRTIGLSKLTESCGFDPLTRVDTLAVAVPEDGEKGDLGVAAKVQLTSDELERCSAGDKDKPKKPTTEQNGFGVVEANGAKLAYGHDGLLVAGKGAWFDLMLATANGKGASLRDAEAHTTLRRDLAALQNAPTLMVTAILPRSLRDRIKNEMQGEVGTTDQAQNAMRGVLGVSSVGVAVHAGPSGSSVNLAAELLCDSGDACAGVEKLVQKKRFDWSKELMLRMVGLGPLLDSIVIKRENTKLTVTASADANALAATVDRVLRYRSRPSAPPPPP